MNGGILDLLCSFPYKWTSINGEVGNGVLELSEVIFSIQNDLYNWGTRDHFLSILSLYVVQYILANPNSPVPLRKNIVRISEFVGLLKSHYFLSTKNNTNICDSKILCNFVVYPLLITLKL